MRRSNKSANVLSCCCVTLIKVEVLLMLLFCVITLITPLSHQCCGTVRVVVFGRSCNNDSVAPREIQSIFNPLIESSSSEIHFLWSAVVSCCLRTNCWWSVDGWSSDSFYSSSSVKSCDLIWYRLIYGDFFGKESYSSAFFPFRYFVLLNIYLTVEVWLEKRLIKQDVLFQLRELFL